MQSQESNKSGFLHWVQESATVKAFFIGFITLLLLIPSAFIQDLVTERAQRQSSIMDDESERWSGSQLINGPVLVIPFTEMQKQTDPKTQAVSYAEATNYLYLLPEVLNYKAGIEIKIKKRGIYEIPVYNGTVAISGSFTKPDFAAAGITEKAVMWDKAKITFGLGDLKGLKNNVIIKAAEQNITVEPALDNSAIFNNALQGNINLSALAAGAITFNCNLDIKGSNELYFAYLGKQTQVSLSGDWSGPSFQGRYSPDESTVTDSAFTANWKLMYYNRPFPQQWVGDYSLLKNKLIIPTTEVDRTLDTVKDGNEKTDAVFGVRLRIPVDQYQKTMRTAKYSFFIILLTFVSLFLTELMGKYRLHVFNYMLIGAAMVIYYTLLLSFAERIGFNYAYMVASAATIGLIATFISSLLKNRKAAALFTLILTVFYGFIFVIIQLEELALMVGSIALFIIVAILMYVSRKINFD